MEPFRLKLKVGPHEFEAEGEKEDVERQFAVWRELIGSPLASPPPSPPPHVSPQIMQSPLMPLVPPASAGNGPQAEAEQRAEYAKLFKHEGRVVSLTMHPQGQQRTADAMLLVLLGQLIFNDAQLVTGQAITDGMKQSGIPVQRVDRSWGPHLDSNVLRTGVNRSVTYRLTNTGVTRAKEIAKELMALVP